MTAEDINIGIVSLVPCPSFKLADDNARVPFWNALK
jgi:hypothetical protein